MPKKNKVTLKEIEIKINQIKLCCNDPESAESQRSDLYVAVLEAIANGQQNAKSLASTALAAENLVFKWV
jgi:sRNA-binding carbon storage regulator CsrA